jgi:hypothetical protein
VSGPTPEARHGGDDPRYVGGRLWDSDLVLHSLLEIAGQGPPLLAAGDLNEALAYDVDPATGHEAPGPASTSTESRRPVSSRSCRPGGAVSGRRAQSFSSIGCSRPAVHSRSWLMGTRRPTPPGTTHSTPTRCPITVRCGWLLPTERCRSTARCVLRGEESDVSKICAVHSDEWSKGVKQPNGSTVHRCANRVGDPSEGDPKSCAGRRWCCLNARSTVERAQAPVLRFSSNRDFPR